ncbi:hypothetical protein [Flavobacterium lipolyticum]|uniref:Ig-like domain-containing protein n=1 Tax=Flavobacterium lipolyticum TaxID=2893754 RepID=A0ABS8M646_9FLAO|nr:hypothetical protein [Flavobacterium sp. F-126]MCC9020275.1 hypothetical protein [Flavobacterium sp. F-126]
MTHKILKKVLVLLTVFFFSSVQAQLTTSTQKVCFGTSKKYSVDLADGVSGTPGSTYNWRVVEAMFSGVIQNQNTNSITVDWGSTPVGEYHLEVTETNSACSGDKVTLVVTIVDLPVVTVNDAVICEGSKATLYATVTPADTGNDYVYEWTTPSGGNPGNVSSITTGTAGNYSVKVKNSLGCVSIASSGIVVVNPLPLAEITPKGSTTFCFGGSVVLNANTGSNLKYQWKKGGMDIIGAVNSSYVATESSDYSVQVTNGNNCIKTSAPISVKVNPLPVAEITILPAESLEFCEGGSVTLLSKMKTNLSYEWRNKNNVIVGTSASYKATESSDYTLKVIDANGCSAISKATSVIVHPLPDASITAIGPTTFCDGDSVVLKAIEKPGFLYQWQRDTIDIIGANNSSYKATESSNYTVTVTDSNFSTNCSRTSPSPVKVVKKLLPVTSPISYD